MKRIFFAAVLCAAVLSACKKADEPTPTPTVVPAPPGIGAPPATFTQKVLIEEFTGAWCGYCPDGAVKVDQLIAANPGKVIGTSIHSGDGMAFSLYNTLNAVYSNSGFPMGMVNRVPYNGSVCMSRGSWTSATNVMLAKTAKCGLAIKSSLSGDSAVVEVQAAFNQNLSGTHTLTVYLIEENVSGTGSPYNQINYYSSANPNGAAGSSSHPYYNQPYNITGYKHMHVVRKVLGGVDMGDQIESSRTIAGGIEKKTFTFSLAGYNRTQLKIVAFVTKNGTTGTTHEVMNVQQANLGELKNWD
jgi:hypothetical protein